MLVFRFLVFGMGDLDNVRDLLGVAAVFFLVWQIAWGGTRAVLRYRGRANRPPS